MIRHAFFNSPRRAKGAGLLEVMVASAILGLGLLGVAAMQITALQGSTSAQYRARATDLAASLADRVRSNLTMDNNYVSAVASGCTAPAQSCAMTPDGTAADACTQANVATYDLWEIRCQNGVRGSLPGGTMSVACTDSDVSDADACTPGSVFSITVNWQGVDGSAADTTVILNFIPGS